MSKDSHAGHFSGHNIPFGIASSVEHPEPQPVTRIQDTVIYLRDIAASGLFSGIPNFTLEALRGPTLNGFAALPTSVHQAVRRSIQQKFMEHGLAGFPRCSKEDITQTTMHVPVEIRDFTGILPSYLTKASSSLKHLCRYIVLTSARKKCRSYNHGK